jgi:chorismate synthase
MQAAIEQARLQGDTLGGVFTLFARGVPCGLGSHAQWDRRLGPALIAAVGSIPAIKGVEIGDAFELSAMSGTQVHDAIRRDAEGRLFRETNRSGGLEGGITTGADIVVRAAMKPISTTMAGIESVDLISGAPTKNKYERSDICAVPRAAVVGEAMIAFVIAGALIEKLGGDSIAETAPRFAQLATPHLRNIHLHGVPWRFEYPVSSDPE